jgi:hypothetical protein
LKPYNFLGFSPLFRYNAAVKRARIGLRLMLLIVALFCVCFAWLRAQMDLRRTEVDRARIALETDLYREERAYKFDLQQISDGQQGKWGMDQNHPNYQPSMAALQNSLKARSARIGSLRKRQKELDR